MTTRFLASSADGQWAVAQHGRIATWLPRGAAPAAGELVLDRDDVELALVGPPLALVALARADNATRVALYEAPTPETGVRPEPVARLELEGTCRLAAITGPRLALLAPDGQHLTIVRAAARAFAQHTIDVGALFDVVVGMPRDQLMIGLPKELKVWDAVSGKPLMKIALALPPPPRLVGTAAGHVWAIRPGGTEVFVYRLSDGRPFRHHVGTAIDAVIAHTSSPVLVLVTARGLVRVHCFAHSLTLVDGVPPSDHVALAQLVIGDDISLLGLETGASEPWRVAIGGAGAPLAPVAAPEPNETLVTAADKLRALRTAQETPSSTTTDHRSAGDDTAVADRSAARTPPDARAMTWRDALVRYGQAITRGLTDDLPVPGSDNELGALADRLELSATARRALAVLYAVYLVGDPAIAISQLAHALGGWDEALGRGELARLAMLRRKRGTVALRSAVTDALDGAQPGAIRLVDGTACAREGVFRVSREGRSDATVEASLAEQLGRLAIATGPLPRAILEARLHAATCVAHAAPAEQPRPWPAGACLVLVLYASPSAWLADLPLITS